MHPGLPNVSIVTSSSSPCLEPRVPPVCTHRSSLRCCSTKPSDHRQCKGRTNLHEPSRSGGETSNSHVYEVHTQELVQHGSTLFISIIKTQRMCKPLAEIILLQSTWASLQQVQTTRPPASVGFRRLLPGRRAGRCPHHCFQGSHVLGPTEGRIHARSPGPRAPSRMTST